MISNKPNTLRRVKLERARNVDLVLNPLFQQGLQDIYNIEQKRIRLSQLLIGNGHLMPKIADADLILATRLYAQADKIKLRFLLSIIKAKNELKGTLREFIQGQLKRNTIELGTNDSASLFIYLYLAILKGEEYTKAFLKTHKEKINLSINAIRNRMLSERLSISIQKFSNEEKNYLIKYMGEALSWQNKEAITKDIPFFHERLNQFLNGRTDQYSGLVSVFKDIEISANLEKCKPYIQLTRYETQRRYLRSLIFKMSKYETGDWSEFNAFYRKIKEVANNFNEKLGNTHLAEWILQSKNNIKEFPEKWVIELNKKLKEIESAEYRRNRVILPFVSEIIQIFKNRYQQLDFKKTELSELKDSVEPIFRLENDIAGSIIKEVNRRTRKAYKKLTKSKKKFELASADCLDKFTMFGLEYMAYRRDIANFQLHKLSNARVRIRKSRIFDRKLLNTAASDPDGAGLGGRTTLEMLHAQSRSDYYLSSGLENYVELIGNLTSQRTKERIQHLIELLKSTIDSYKGLEALMNEEFSMFMDNN